jgi:glycosyltransferase involved in cell wall biosynthesis
LIKPSTEILYVTYDGLSDPLGQAQILPYILALNERGFKFHIISAEKNKSAIKPLYDLLKDRGIEWYPVFYHKNPPVLSTLYDLHKMYKNGVKVIEKNNIAIVHNRSYLPQILYTLWKKKFSYLKSVFDIRGFWIDERIEGNIWQYKGVYKIIVDKLRKIEPNLYKEAFHVVTLTNRSRNIVAEKFYKSKDKITVIPCATELNIPDVDKERLKKELGLNNRFPIFVYSGSVGTWYMIKEMFDFFSVAKEAYPGATFLFLSNVRKQELMRLAPNQIDENDVVVNFVRHEDVTKYLQIADVGLFFIKPLWSKQASSPTKMGEMLAAGLPIITNDIGDVKEIVEKYDCGVVVDKFEAKEYKEVIKKIEILLDKGEKNARKAALEVFSLYRAVEKYNAVYVDIKNQ